MKACLLFSGLPYWTAEVTLGPDMVFLFLTFLCHKVPFFLACVVEVHNIREHSCDLDVLLILFGVMAALVDRPLHSEWGPYTHVCVYGQGRLDVINKKVKNFQRT